MSTLYAPYRTIGIVCDKNEFVLNRLGEENFITVSIGNCFQVFRVAHKLAVCLVSRPYSDADKDNDKKYASISCLQVWSLYLKE
jgi:hypothetical protein